MPLQDIYAWATWESLRNGIVSLLVILGFMDILLLVMTTLCMPCAGRVECLPRALRLSPASRARAVAVGVALLLLQIYTTVLLMALGLLLVVSRTLVSIACEKLTGLGEGDAFSATSICIDLSGIGLEEVRSDGASAQHTAHSTHPPVQSTRTPLLHRRGLAPALVGCRVREPGGRGGFQMRTKAVVGNRQQPRPTGVGPAAGARLF